MDTGALIREFCLCLIGGVFAMCILTVYCILTMEHPDEETQAEKLRDRAIAEACRKAANADESDRREVREVRILGIPGI